MTTIAATAAEPPPYPTDDCLEILARQIEATPLLGKIHTGQGEPDIALLALNEKPTAEEGKLVLRWARGRDYCFSLGAEYRQRHAHPTERLIAERVNADARALRAALAGGELTYGQYARRIADLGLRAQQEWEIESRRVRAEQQRAHDQAAGEYLRWQAQHPTAVDLFIEGFQRSRGARTDCRPTGVGGAVTCTTR